MAPARGFVINQTHNNS